MAGTLATTRMKMRSQLLVALAICTNAVIAQPSLIPWPQEVRWMQVNFPLQQVHVIEGAGAEGWGSLLRSDLRAHGALALNQDEIMRAVRFQRDTALGDEAYVIRIDEKQVDVIAATFRSAIHATETLRQLAFTDSAGRHQWPCVQIQDHPAHAWRGTMLDVCRHFYSVDFLKRYLDELARLKLNVFHWHLTDDQGWRVEVKKYPRLTQLGAWRTESDGTRYGGFYTQEQVKDIVQYAAARGITVVPEIEFPGHCSAAIASYPWLGCTQDTLAVPNTWGVFNDVYCVGRDSTWTFIKDVLDELVPLFPAPWFHIGGDEVPKTRWSTCAVCQARMQQEGLKDEHALQAWAVKRIQAYLTGKGKRMIGWDEILEGGLDNTAVVEVWRGDEQARKARANGNAMIRTLYFDASPANLTMQQVMDFDPMLDGDTSGILGAECPVWSEAIDARNIGYQVFPRLQAFAEKLWLGRVGEDFVKRTAPQMERLEREGWITATAAQDLFRSSVRFIPDSRSWLVQVSCGRTDMNVAWSGNERQGVITDSLSVHAPGVIRLTPRWKGTAVKDPVSITIAPNLALGARQTVVPPPSPKYGDDPAHGLTDGLLGTDHYGDGLWQGWQGVDPVVTIDLDRVRNIHAVSFEASVDGKTWQLLSTATHHVPAETPGPLVHVFHAELDAPLPVRFLRATLNNSGPLPAWHSGAGGSSWTFADEVLVE
jgi:hexosaminidase